MTGVETLRFDDGDITVSHDTSLNQLVLTGDVAADNITIVGSVPVTVYGDEGDNIIVGGSGDDTIEAGAGNDTIEGGDGDDTIEAGAGNDRWKAGMVMTPSRLVLMTIRSMVVTVDQ